jgi:MYXO-CTERM domain-containing protein
MRFSIGTMLSARSGRTGRRSGAFAAVTALVWMAVSCSKDANSVAEYSTVSQALRVEDHGARGDGTTDDTAALRRAFAALGSGGQIVFQAGKTYLVSGSVAVTDKSNYTLVGNRATVRAANGTGSVGPLLHLVRNRNVIWRDLTVLGNRANRTCREAFGYHNIALSNVKDFTLERIHSHDACTDGFYVYGSSTAGTDSATFTERGKIIDGEAFRNYRQGLSIINARDLEVIGGSYSFTLGTWPMAGIDIEPNPSSAVPGAKGITIRGARFEGNEGSGVFVTGIAGVEDVIIEDNYFKANKIAGAELHAKNVTVRRNLFEDFTVRTTRLRGDGSEVPSVYVGIIPVNNDRGGVNRILDNTVRRASHYTTGAIYVRNSTVVRPFGTGTISGNCFESVKAPAIRNDRPADYSMSNNRENPPGGCPDPRRNATGGGDGGVRDGAGNDLQDRAEPDAGADQATDVASRPDAGGVDASARESFAGADGGTRPAADSAPRRSPVDAAVQKPDDDPEMPHAKAEAGCGCQVGGAERSGTGLAGLLALVLAAGLLGRRVGEGSE